MTTGALWPLDVGGRRKVEGRPRSSSQERRSCQAKEGAQEGLRARPRSQVRGEERRLFASDSTESWTNVRAV